MEIKTLLASSANYLGLLDSYAYARRSVCKSQVAILLYHRVCPKQYTWCREALNPSAFEKHLTYLCSNFEILSLDELGQLINQDKSLPGKAAVITLDDGYRDNFLYAYPILKKYHIPATIFLVTGHIGSNELIWPDKVDYIIENTTVEQLDTEELGSYRLESTHARRHAKRTCIRTLKTMSPTRRGLSIENLLNAARVSFPIDSDRDSLLSWDEIKEMSNNGITLGAHTVTHPVLTGLDPEQARWEIIESKKIIEQELSKKVTCFAYPFGEPNDFNSTVIKTVREAGFNCAVTCKPCWVNHKSNTYSMGRIVALEDLSKLKAMLSGFWPDLKKLFHIA